MRILDLKMNVEILDVAHLTLEALYKNLSSGSIFSRDDKGQTKKTINK